jgi:cytosine deaminase
MVTSRPAQLINRRDYGIAVENPADIVVLDATDKASALAELATPLLGIKRGRRSFVRQSAVLNRP